MSTARPRPIYNRVLTPRRSPSFDGALLDTGGAVETPFPGVVVEIKVVNDAGVEMLALALLNGGITMDPLPVTVPVENDAEVTVSVPEPPAEVVDDRGKVDGPTIGIDVVNERGGEGVTEGMVAVIVVVNPPGIVVVRVITSVALVLSEEPDVPDGVPVARELLIRF